MIRFLLFAILFTSTTLVNAQSAFWPDSLMQCQKELSVLGKQLRDGETQMKREKAAKEIIPLFRKALSMPGAFQFDFDSLDYMSKLRPDDNSFRLFTWVLKLDGNRFRYFGVMHVKTQDSFIYHPLFDRSSDVQAGLVGKKDPNGLIEDSTYSNKNWFGMYYYAIGLVKQKKWFGLKSKPYYVLIGWDGNNGVSHKKIVDVIHFEDGKPIIGAPVFSVENKIQTRFVLEFNAQASITLKYHNEHKMVSFDHLMPPNAKNEGDFFTYIPSGKYDYLIWRRNKFILKRDLFNTFKKDIDEAQ